MIVKSDVTTLSTAPAGSTPSVESVVLTGPTPVVEVGEVGLGATFEFPFKPGTPHTIHHKKEKGTVLPPSLPPDPVGFLLVNVGGINYRVQLFAAK